MATFALIHGAGDVGWYWHLGRATTPWPPICPEGDRSRLVWLTDVLPHTVAPAVKARVERGIVEIKRTLESTDTE